jgi:hypothetical protein
VLKKAIPHILLILFIAPIFSCRKDSLINDSGAKVKFSVDSILFDTVFTQVGSTTKSFVVYNNNDEAIQISSIKLARGNSSFFRLNVDGVAGKTFTDIIIPRKDSIFIFVEVTVDPTNVNNPLIIKDSIVFITNNNVQDVKLEAWGQDAYFHVPNVITSSGFAYSIIAEAGKTVNWVNDKPHVIYGYAVVDSAGILNMSAGTRVHLHKGAVLWVFKDGTLDVQGAAGVPVRFEGDRLEPEYNETPGQWGKIWLSALSKNNKIDWAVIKNGSIGLQADTVKLPNPTLRISNTIVKNMSSTALFAQGAHVKAFNCVFANCGQYTAALTIGGRYYFNHCTFANYWSPAKGTRTTPAVLVNNWYTDVNKNPQKRNIDSAQFNNCIVYGNIDNEFGLDSSAGGNFRYKLNNTLVKTNLTTNDGYHYSGVLKNANTAFKNVSSNDYQIGTTSAAKDAGIISIGTTYPTDLNNLPRNADAAPDLGAYEFKP